MKLSLKCFLRPPPIPQDRTRFGRLLSPPVTTMALTLALSATGVLPVESVVYDTVWSWLVPLSTALYLLDADLSLLFKAGRDALMGFLAGSVGTLAGLTAAWSALGHTGWLGPEGAKLCAALTASYVGGSVNFAAVSAALGVTHRPSMVAALAADNLVMAGYLAVLMVLVRLVAMHMGALGAVDMPMSSQSIQSLHPGQRQRDQVPRSPLAPSRPRRTAHRARTQARVARRMTMLGPSHVLR